MFVYFSFMRTKDPNKAAQIRSKALTMIVEEGLDGFSMQKLAKAAQVSPATLYIHFEDREDLLFQLYREQHALWAEEVLRDFDPECSFEDGMRIQWRNRLRFSREHPLAQTFNDQLIHSPYHRAFAPRMDPRFHDAMATFVGNAIERGEIFDLRRLAPDDPFPIELFWSLAYAPLYQIIQYEIHDQGPGRRKRNTPFRIGDAQLEEVLRRVVRGLAP